MKRIYLELAALVISAIALAACNQVEAKHAEGLLIEKQGVFSSGGRVTAPIPGDYDATKNWMDFTRKGTTTHVDHANTFYQIPANGNGTPIVFLHGYGQTRTGWQATPDGREGWSDIFLKKGYSVFLVDQPRRGAAGATEEIVNNSGDTDGGKFKVGEQAWYTHFRIGRVAPERYEGSQFPAGAEAQNQFFCQMTPNTGNYDEALFGKALSAVLSDTQKMTEKKSIYITHSQGGRVGWATDTDNMAAIIAVEPGGAPQVGSETYQKFVAAKVPILFLFGDYIKNGPEDIMSTAFWQGVMNQCIDFANHYNEDGGDATMIYLPDVNINGNSHFMFQEMNNKEIADLVENWLKTKNL
jgi:pimeloyl-ACP methyl ester carboxylesterase